MQNICFINFTRKFENWDFANRAVIFQLHVNIFPPNFLEMLSRVCPNVLY